MIFLMLNDLADTVPTKAALALAVVSMQDVFDSLAAEEDVQL